MLNKITILLQYHSLKQVAKNGSIVSVGHIAGIVIAILSSYFFANYLDKEIYGTYQFVLTIASLMAIFTLRGTEKRIIRAYVRDKEDTLITSAYQLFIYSLPIALTGIFAGLYFEFKGNTTLFLSITLIAATFPFIKSFSIYTASHLAREQFTASTVTNIIQVFVPTISLIIAIVADTSLLGLVATYSLSQLVTCAALFAHTVYATTTQFKKKSTKVMRSEIHLSLSQSLLDIGKLVDRLLAFSTLGAAALASYMIGLLPIRESLRVNQILRALVLPRYSKYNYEQVRSQVLKKTFLLFVTYSALAVIYVLSAPLLFSVLFPQYGESIFYTQILAILLPLSSIFLITEMLTVFDKTKELYIANTLYLLLLITLMPLLTAEFGVMGLIWAKIIATTVHASTQVISCLNTKIVATK